MRIGQGTEHADAGLEHEFGCAHTRQEGDLRIPRIDVCALAHDDLPGVTVGHDLLLGQGQLDRPEAHPQLEALAAEVAERLDRRMRIAVIERLLDALIVELRRRLDHGPANRGFGGGAIGRDVDRPYRGPAYLIGKQAQCVLRQRRRVQRDAGIRKVDGLAAPTCLGVNRAIGRYDRAEVGDRVVHPEAVADSLEEHCLVKVLGTGRIDRDERDARGVLDLTGMLPRNRGGFGFGRLGELAGVGKGREIELGPDGIEVMAHGH